MKRFLAENWLWILAPIVIVLGLLYAMSQMGGDAPSSAGHVYRL